MGWDKFASVRPVFCLWRVSLIFFRERGINGGGFELITTKVVDAYEGGTHRMKNLTLILSFALCSGFFGCAGSSQNLTPIRFSEIEPGFEAQLPMVIQFEKGERIPLDLVVGGDFFELEGRDGSSEVVVKRRFYVHFSKNDPPWMTLDGKTKGSIKGSVSIGFGISKNKGARANLGFTAEERD